MAGKETQCNTDHCMTQMYRCSC